MILIILFVNTIMFSIVHESITIIPLSLDFLHGALTITETNILGMSVQAARESKKSE